MSVRTSLCRCRLLSSRRRALCTASARTPLLPQWGSFGRSSEEISDLVEQVKADGEHQATISKELAEFGLKLTGMLSRPIQWFSDPEWRDGWIETAREPLERYSRINDRLLDGCEEAYAAIAAEFHAEDPNFQQYVDSGALDPQLAMLLEESLAKYAAVGRRPVLEQGRCNAQVLIVDSMSMDTGFTATVVFRSREARDSALISTAQPRARPEGSVATGVSDPHLAKQDEDAQADSMDEQTTMANITEANMRKRR